MTAIDEPLIRRSAAGAAAPTVPRRSRASVVVGWMTSTDHKVIGYLYLATSFVFFLFGGVLALIIRAQLARPANDLVGPQMYNELFTMHGGIMLLLFATPTFIGFGNVVMPLQIGAPDVAFPRLNMFSYWLFLFGGLTVASSFLTPNGAASFGWYSYSPLTNEVNSPGVGSDLWIMGLWMAGIGTILGAVNFITTILSMRAPGMTMFRMPIFTWNILMTSVLVLVAFPIFGGALLALEADRRFGAHVFDAASGGAILWQHLFWFFGHPEVYIIALPFFGIITEILPVFSRKPVFGYKGLVGATVSITALSVAVWAHHMFTTGAVDLPFFSFMSFLIAVPTGVKFFNWIGTMWRGAITFETPMLWAIGFLVTFLFGGLTGVLLASPPLDFQASDSYFVVAHFHYVVFGTVVFATFAGFYFWWPKWTGRMLDERLGKIHFWMLFVGFHTTFLVQHWLGVEGMPRRYWSYRVSDGFATLNAISSVGAFLLGLSMLPFMINVWVSRKHPKVTVDDPWGYGASLEWATSCPPPRHNFDRLPRIRSERPAFDLKFPHLAAASDRVDEEDLLTPGRTGAAREEKASEIFGEALVKTERLIFGIISVFFLIVTPIYYLLSHEVTGTVALILAFFLTLIITSYVAITGRKLPPRPEDRLDGDIEDGVGEIGFFSPHSIWPLWAAIAFALVVLGVVIGWWLLIIAMVFMVMATIGFTFEYYREVPDVSSGPQGDH